MIKVYLAIGILAATAASCFWAGYQVATGKEAKKEVKIIYKEIENHNEDIVSLSKHTREIERIREHHKKELANLSLLSNTNDCNVDDFKRLWNEAAEISNSVRIKN